MWAELADAPRLSSYQKLEAHADRLGQWPEWRERALAFLRDRLEQAGRASRDDRSRWAGRLDRSELVRIFLWEGDGEAAWREAVEGGCSEDLWLRLAAARRERHPEDALAVYRRLVEPTLEGRNNEAYKEAVGLLRDVRDLMAGLGRAPEFAAYLEDIRARHRRKRNFLRLSEEL